MFVAKDYFGIVSKMFVLKEIEKTISAHEARKAGSKGKADADDRRRGGGQDLA